MRKNKKNKKKTPKLTIFLTFIFIGFVAGTVLGIGLKQIESSNVVAQSIDENESLRKE
ncbi:MAG: hypothetical protein ACRC7B_02895 [Metamycoplasmataceae bacterium]